MSKGIQFIFVIDKEAPMLGNFSFEALGDISTSIQKMLEASFGKGFVYTELNELPNEEDEITDFYNTLGDL